MNKPPLWFTVIAGVALLWNLVGCAAFVIDLRLSPADIAGMPEAQQAMYSERPVWASVANAVGVLGGVTGCVGLLLRRRWAQPALIASLVGIVVVDVGLFVLADGARAFGPPAVILQGVVAIVAVGLIVLGRRAIVRGWIR